jgi:outer membrane protein TolC
MGNQRLDIQLMQMFPWFGILKTQKSEAASMASAKYELFRNAKNNLFFQVKNTSYQLYELQQEERIVSENLEILRIYERLALIRFESGTGSGSSSGGASKSMNSAQINTSSTSSMGGGMNTPAGSAQAPKQSMSPAASMGASKSGMSDVLRIRMEIRDLENELALLQSSKVPLQAEFNQLLNRDYLTPIEITEKLNEVVLSLNSIALLDSISENNPMLKMLDAEVDAYQSQKEMARLTARPMIGVGINYIPFSPRMENGMQMGGGDMMMPMLTLSLPIYGKKYQAMAKEADLLQQSVRLRKESLTNQLTTQWSIVIRDLEDANRRTALYKEQTALARQTLNVLIASYSANGSEFEEVLRVQQQLLTYELKHITAIINQHTAVAQLELLTAKALD